MRREFKYTVFGGEINSGGASERDGMCFRKHVRLFDSESGAVEHARVVNGRAYKWGELIYGERPEER